MKRAEKDTLIRDNGTKTLTSNKNDSFFLIQAGK